MSRYILSLIISILLITEGISAAVVYPSATPSAETTGGTFNQYFTNMFTPTCTNGQVISGFTSSGILLCSSIAGDLSSDSLWKKGAEYSQSTGGEVVGDLVLHFDGTDGSTDIVNDGNKILPPITVEGDVSLSTTDSKFGGSSLYFSGNGKVQVDVSSILTSSYAGDWTIELWVKKIDGAYWCEILGFTPWGTGDYGLNISATSYAGNNYEYQRLSNPDFTDPTGSWVSSVSATDNVWRHIALVRSSNIVKFYIDGILQKTQSVSGGSNFGIGQLTIGQDGNNLGDNTFQGYIDDLRITRSAIYNTNFTPLPISNTSGTNSFNIYTESGNVGIGTSTPVAKLEVNGEIKIGNTSIACTSATEGSLRYNTTKKLFEGCDGTKWGVLMMAPKYTITWNAGSGTLIGSGKTIIPYPDAIESLPVATLTGYSFSGWYTEPVGGKLLTVGTVPEQNTTYYAQYNEIIELYCDTYSSAPISCAGLPDIMMNDGSLWKACNVGAKYLCQAGSYFQWGSNTPGYNIPAYDENWTRLYTAPNGGWGFGWNPIDYYGYLNGPGFGQGPGYDTLSSYTSVGSPASMQGPCPSGYHVPTPQEWCRAVGVSPRTTWWPNNDGQSTVNCYEGSLDAMYGASFLYLPKAGSYSSWNGQVEGLGSHQQYWTSMIYHPTYDTTNAFRFTDWGYGPSMNGYYQDTASATPVRCMKNAVATNTQITFDINGGSGSNIIVTSNDFIIIPSDPVREGYQFSGWYTSLTGGTQVNNYSSTPSGDTTYYARWTRLYVITFDPNGGVGGGIRYIVPGSSIYISVTEPTLSGYQFSGWYTSLTGGTQVNNYSSTPSGDTTYYARWTRLYVITFDPNGGVGGGIQYIVPGSQLGPFPADPYMTGKYFAGWWINSGPQVLTTTVPNGDITYYAGFGNISTWATTSYSGCTSAGITYTANSTYGACNEPDKVICTGNNQGYIWSMCNAGSNIAGTGQSSYGNFYQWGRNTPFPSSGNISSINGPLNIGSVNSSTPFIGYPYMPSGDIDWLAPQNSNLWGGSGTINISGTYRSSTQQNRTLMQGPCLYGYHVPTAKEACDTIDSLNGTQGCTSSKNNNIYNILKVPLTGYRDYSYGTLYNEGTYTNWWLSSSRNGRARQISWYNPDKSIYPNYDAYRISGISIRCIKDF